jgi:DNA-binding IclR family transcriptional regulator
MLRRNPRTADPKKPPVRYRAPALEKGLDIIELLADRPEGLGQAEAARCLKRSVGEIFRMLACLVDRGYLGIKRPGDVYVLTPKIFELSHRHAPSHRLLADALPMMRELATRVRQSCHLVVAYEGKGVVVAQADHPFEMGFSVRAGCTVDLLRSASGRVLLAFQDSVDRGRMLRECGVKPQSPDGMRLSDELDRVRRRGWEEIESTRVRGVHDFSFPITDHRGAAAAALTVPFIERLDATDSAASAAVRSALAATAARLSEAVGGRGARVGEGVLEA